MRTYNLWWCGMDQKFRATGCQKGHEEYDFGCGSVMMTDTGPAKPGPIPPPVNPWRDPNATPWNVTINGVPQTPYCPNQPCAEHTGCRPYPPSVGEATYG